VCDILFYVAVFNGLYIIFDSFPHLTMWATNILPSSTALLKRKLLRPPDASNNFQSHINILEKIVAAHQTAFVFFDL